MFFFLFAFTFVMALSFIMETFFLLLLWFFAFVMIIVFAFFMLFLLLWIFFLFFFHLFLSLWWCWRRVVPRRVVNLVSSLFHLVHSFHNVQVLLAEFALLSLSAFLDFFLVHCLFLQFILLVLRQPV